MYRMNHQSFTKLCGMLHPLLAVDEHMSNIRTSKSAISTEITLHCLICWLAGGSYLDIRVAAGISRPSFYHCIHSAMTAIVSTPELEIRLPTTAAEFAEIAKGFEEISSTNGILNGCAAVFDGYLMQTSTVSRAQVGNVKAYFSGHYQCFGVNVQGMVDSKCRFMFLAAVAPGGTNNIVAFRKCPDLKNYIDNLPLGQYVIGDNAYVCGEHILTPFAGVERTDFRKDAYNFYVSQLRIRVEMAFGMMANRWQILKRPVSESSPALVASPTLGVDQSFDDPNEAAEAFMASDVTVLDVPGNSIMRDFLVDRIADAGLRRPGVGV